MSRFASRGGICSVLLAAAVCCAGMDTASRARAGTVTTPDGSAVSTGDVGGVDDFGGTPAGVESQSPGSPASNREMSVQSDQTNARHAVERGEVRPFGWLLKKLKKAVPGDVVKVRLRRNGLNIWTYEVTVLNASGRFVQVSLNAATGAIISSKFR